MKVSLGTNLYLHREWFTLLFSISGWYTPCTRIYPTFHTWIYVILPINDVFLNTILTHAFTGLLSVVPAECQNDTLIKDQCGYFPHTSIH